MSSFVAKRRRRWAWILGGLAGLLAVLLIGVFLLHTPRPDLSSSAYRTGPAAEKQADRMAAAVGQSAWEGTGAIRFRFAGHRYLWDRTRGAFEVRYQDSGSEIRVLEYTDRRAGFVYVDGVPLAEHEQSVRFEEAWGYFANDSFWLAAPFKTRDPGTKRFVSAGVTNDLFVAYGAGGVTPGDLYRWRLDEDGRPVAFELWVSIMPIGGLSASWENWKRVSTGARLATEHRPFGLPIVIQMEGVEAAAELAELLGSGPDPFERMFASSEGEGS